MILSPVITTINILVYVLGAHSINCRPIPIFPSFLERGP